jgi:hypothetical protein
MRRNALFVLIAAILIAIGGYFFMAGETAQDDTLTVAQEPAVPPGEVGVATPTPPAETPASDLVPANE